MLATDASLTGWGAVMSDHPARGLWNGRHLTWHIHCLEMLAVFRALKHFLPDLRDLHALVRADILSRQGLRQMWRVWARRWIRLRLVRHCTVPSGYLWLAGCYCTNLAEALSVHLYPIALLTGVLERVRRDGVHLLLKPCSYREAYAKWWIRMLFYNLESSDLPSPLGVKAHSTQGMSAPKAFLVLQCCRVVYAPHIRQVLDNVLRATPGSSVLLP